MELNKDFNIKFAGLKNGKHLFNFEIEETFFDYFTVDSEEVELPVVVGKADVVLDKMSTMLTIDVDLKLIWKTWCDICGEDMEEKITSNNRFFVKFGNEDSLNEDILVLSHNDYEFNISPFIYEFIITSLPSKKKHKEEACNQEVIDKLKSLTPNSNNKENNPLWDQLKNLS